MIHRLARSVAHLEGCAAELGVYCGGSAKTICQALPGKTVHLFDTFQGIPFDDTVGVHRKGEFAADETAVRQYLSEYDVVFHVGYFPDTTIDFLYLKFCFVHLDADLYQSTLDGIDYFWPRLVPGGILCFHDWNWKACAGVDRAIQEKQLVVSSECHQCWAVKCT